MCHSTLSSENLKRKFLDIQYFQYLYNEEGGHMIDDKFFVASVERSRSIQTINRVTKNQYLKDLEWKTCVSFQLPMNIWELDMVPEGEESFGKHRLPRSR